MQFDQMSATMEYWFPGEQLERERRAQKMARAAEAMRTAAPSASRPARKQALIPRIAGALGLF